MEYSQEVKLVQMCKEDKKYFATLYDNYVKDVYRYAYSISYDREKAQDATSHCFLKALENIDKFNYKGKSIKAWFFVITRNFIYSSSKRVEYSVEEEIIDAAVKEDESVLNTLISEENEAMVNRCLAKLSSVENEIIRLKIWEDFGFNEICEVTGLGLSAVKMKYYRSLEKMKELLNI